jgi:hypothetical protein
VAPVAKNGSGYSVKGWALWAGLASFAAVLTMLVTTVFWLADRTRPTTEVREIATSVFQAEFDERTTWEDERGMVLADMSSLRSIVEQNQNRLDRAETAIQSQLDRLDNRLNELLLAIQRQGG